HRGIEGARKVGLTQGRGHRYSTGYTSAPEWNTLGALLADGIGRAEHLETARPAKGGGEGGELFSTSSRNGPCSILAEAFSDGHVPPPPPAGGEKRRSDR